MNNKIGLFQYYSGGDVAPEADDLLVFTDTKYEHVAIIAVVAENDIEVIQQNIYGKTRQKHLLVIKDGRYYIGKDRTPAGWLCTE